jgi:hypothetical protein
LLSCEWLLSPVSFTQLQRPPPSLSSLCAYNACSLFTVQIFTIDFSVWQVKALSILAGRIGGVGAKTARSLLLFLVLAAAKHAHMMVSYYMYCIEFTITNTRVSVQSCELAPPTPPLQASVALPLPPGTQVGGNHTRS